jgi:hypothetical protein
MEAVYSFQISAERALLSVTVSTRVEYLPSETGRVVAQAVSQPLPTATVRVRALLKSCGIHGG